MRKKLLSLLLSQIMRKAPELGKELIDDILDKIEDRVEASSTKIDDAIILPLIKMLRDTAGIPDDIGGDED